MDGSGAFSANSKDLESLLRLSVALIPASGGSGRLLGREGLERVRIEQRVTRGIDAIDDRDRARLAAAGQHALRSLDRADSGLFPTGDQHGQIARGSQFRNVAA